MHAHAGTAGVSRVHTRPASSWCYVQWSTHRRTQNRHGGACRPHKCACVRDEFMPLCLMHVRAYVNTPCARTFAPTRPLLRARAHAPIHRLVAAPSFLLETYFASAGPSLLWFPFDKARQNQGNIRADAPEGYSASVGE